MKLPESLLMQKFYLFDGSTSEKGMHMHMHMVVNMHISIIIVVVVNFLTMLSSCSVFMSVL